jgi:hypothetical protein
MGRATSTTTGRASGRFRDPRELVSAAADSSSAGNMGVETDS